MIRDATDADIPSIFAIWNHEIRDTVITFNSVEKTPEDLSALLVEKAKLGFGFLVAETEGAISGFATYGQFRGGYGYRHTAEHSVVIAPDARGTGVGRALMGAIERHARRSDFHSMWAGVSAENKDAVRFHSKLGYTQIARLPEVGRKFDRWHDLILMQKHL